MAIPNQYPQANGMSIIPAADLLSATSAANTKSAGRLGDAGIGKRLGMTVIRDAGAGDYRLVMAMGSAPTDVWRVVDGSTNYTPS